MPFDCTKLADAYGENPSMTKLFLKVFSVIVSPARPRMCTIDLARVRMSAGSFILAGTSRSVYCSYKGETPWNLYRLEMKFWLSSRVLSVKFTSRNPWISTTDVSVPAAFASKVFPSIVNYEALIVSET